MTYGSSQSHSVAKSKGEYQTLLKRKRLCTADRKVS